MTQVLELSRLIDRTLGALADVLGAHADRRPRPVASDRRFRRPRPAPGADPGADRFRAGHREPGRGEDVTVDDLRAARPLGFPGVAARVSEVRAVLSVPLRTEEQLIGTLNFYDRMSHEWQPAKVRAGERLGELMVMVLQAPADRTPISGQS
ncbi:GAF domain-containing protein [Streptosporangium sp. NPDC002544]|uniref:GAF domain-containing protein n=1 Tax=Streptosporangium sp. NPDC002544 TaxID=3154538 RepID=UPI003319D769